MDAAVLQVLVPVAIAVLGAGWALTRFEFNRYAAAHPAAPLVKDAQVVIREAKALAPVLGITPQKVSGFIAGALSAHGHTVPAHAILATEQAVAQAAAADLARVQQASAAASPTPAPAAPAPEPAPAPAAPAPAASPPVAPAAPPQ